MGDGALFHGEYDIRLFPNVQLLRTSYINEDVPLPLSKLSLIRATKKNATCPGPAPV